MTFPKRRVLSIRQRLRLLVACWLGIFVVVMTVDMVLPRKLWGEAVRIPFNFAVAPAALLTGQYFLVSSRSARRYWLVLRLVLANWLTVDGWNVIAARGTKQRVRRPRRTIYPFWWAVKR